MFGFDIFFQEKKSAKSSQYKSCNVLIHEMKSISIALNYNKY